MPQFDGSTVATQLFWLVITFCILYFIMWKIMLPKVAEVLEARQDKIDDDLDRAAAFKSEAEEVLADYEKTLAETTAEAQGLVRQADEDAKNTAATQHAEQSVQLAEKIAAAEATIRSAQADAAKNIDNVASEVAQSAVERLIGVQVDPGSAAQAVAAAQGKG